MGRLGKDALALIGLITAIGAPATPASASIPAYTTVVNDMDYNVTRQASSGGGSSGGGSCWNDDDFSNGGIVAANSSYAYYSSVRDNDGNCVAAVLDPNAHLYLELHVPAARRVVQQPILDIRPWVPIAIRLASRSRAAATMVSQVASAASATMGVPSNPAWRSRSAPSSASRSVSACSCSSAPAGRTMPAGPKNGADSSGW
jgi:hypothetical protein